MVRQIQEFFTTVLIAISFISVGEANDRDHSLSQRELSDILINSSLARTNQHLWAYQPGDFHDIKAYFDQDFPQHSKLIQFPFLRDPYKLKTPQSERRIYFGYPDFLKVSNAPSFDQSALTSSKIDVILKEMQSAVPSISILMTEDSKNANIFIFPIQAYTNLKKHVPGMNYSAPITLPNFSNLFDSVEKIFPNTERFEYSSSELHGIYIMDDLNEISLSLCPIHIESPIQQQHEQVIECIILSSGLPRLGDFLPINDLDREQYFFMINQILEIQSCIKKSEKTSLFDLIGEELPNNCH